GQAFRYLPREFEEIRLRQGKGPVYLKRFRKRFPAPNRVDREAMAAFARDGVKDGLLEEPVQVYRVAIGADPAWSVPYAELGDLLRATFRYDEELAVYRGAGRRGAANEEVLRREGDALARLGLYEEAEAAFRRALDAGSGHVPSKLGLGRVLLAGRRPSEAQEAFRAASQGGTPTDTARALQGLGRSLLRLGDLDGARKALSRGRELAPADPAVRGLDGGPLGRELASDHAAAELSAGDAGKAIEGFLQVLELTEPPKPPAPPATPTGEPPKEAASPAAAPPPLAPDYDPFRSRVLTDLGLALTQAKRYPEGRETFRQAAGLDPTAAAPWVGLGALEEGERRWSDARASYARAIEVDPADPSGHFALGQLLLRAGSAAEAQEALLEAVKLDPDLPDALSLLGHVALAQDRSGDAARYFSRALDGLDVPALWASLGVARLRTGDLDGAKQAFDEALRRDRDQTTAKEGVAWLLYMQAKGRRDREDSAVERLKKMAGASPYSADALARIADARGKQQWRDDFERPDGELVRNRWGEQDDRGVAVRVTGGRVRFEGTQKRGDDTSLLRPVSPEVFVSIEATLLAEPAQLADARLELASTVAGSEDPLGGIFVGKSRTGKVVWGTWDPREKRWAEKGTASEWPAGEGGKPALVRLAIERLAEGGRPTDRYRISVRGEAIVPALDPGFRLGGTSRAGLSASADIDTTFSFEADDVRIVERKG
ncbi:MAG: tetratricopeptide repeat protein, partial [Planctomycetales bacterium]|nr:tetratricopeptide repeat protein [Planctomycetales bacterium]